MSSILWYDPDRLPTIHANSWQNRFDQKLVEIETSGSIKDALFAFLDAIPIDRFPYVTLTQLSGAQEPIASSFPWEWGVEYVSGQYADDDPVLYLASRQASWFGFAGAIDRARSLGARAKTSRIMHAAAEHGLADGLLIPYFGPNGDRTTLTLAGPKKATDLPMDQTVKVLALARALMHKVGHLKAESTLHDESCAELTDREIECLKWIGAGKTSQDVATIIGIANNTVDFHLKNAMKKLNTSSRTQAFGLAVASGQVSLPSFGQTPNGPTPKRNVLDHLVKV
jgi:DNA-binding CsgD family transcriptional regulator